MDGCFECMKCNRAACLGSQLLTFRFLSMNVEIAAGFILPDESHTRQANNITCLLKGSQSHRDFISVETDNEMIPVP